MSAVPGAFEHGISHVDLRLNPNISRSHSPILPPIESVFTLIMSKTTWIKSLAGITAVALISTATYAGDGASNGKVTSDAVSPSKQGRDAQIDSAGRAASNDSGINASGTSNADNTGRNKRDRNNATLTPGDQGRTKEDVEVTRQIRRGIVRDKSLSITAKNIKIITRDGNVTLRGPVKTETEKEAILAKAKEIATTAHPVTDQLEVKSDLNVNVQNKSSKSDSQK